MISLSTLEKGKLTIMSYNIQMLSIPFSIHLNSWMRRNAIIEYINVLDDLYNIDILVLNEVFTKKSYELLTSGEIKKRFPYHTNVVGKKCKSNECHDDILYNEEKDTLSYISRDSYKNEEDTCFIMQNENDNEINIQKEKLIKNIDNKNKKDISNNIEFSNFDTITGNAKFYQFFNGGVLVLSKHKILQKHALIYSCSTFPDMFCSKGAIYLKCEVNDKRINIIATHLQAGDKIKQQNSRMKQLNELSKWVYEGIPSHFIKKYEPLFFVGDLNIRYDVDKLYLEKVLSKTYLNSHVTKRSLETTFDSFLNDYCRYIENDYTYKYKYTLDYILVSNDSNIKIIVPQTAIQDNFRSLLFIKFFWGFIPYKTTYIHHPSDHFPIYATFQI
ncbi:sphingomyelin phosphodiesterase, putative [Plasmodium gallinaceum]|uniref:Sphingomyelin phosphodiesterase, putative n=1 Tax=Plasmodium gallinaceum TaxID=5849 RepID=A0A1J1GX29_PLAGA|nr:sphingomyelin phosphodiesterase, putative [Plasmodium gallinaceum]CRG97023.1 sphingomyelin phosphodiesterase, putative [Plasmodium gallinaceum]